MIVPTRLQCRCNAVRKWRLRQVECDSGASTCPFLLLYQTQKDSTPATTQRQALPLGGSHAVARSEWLAQYVLPASSFFSSQMPSLAEGIEWFRSIRGMIRCDTVAVHRNLLTETGLVSLRVAIESAMCELPVGSLLAFPPETKERKEGSHINFWNFGVFQQHSRKRFSEVERWAEDTGESGRVISKPCGLHGELGLQ